jgi:hypothetical protein
MQTGEIERENPARICNQIKLEWLQSTKQVSSSYEREIRSPIKEKFQTISELEALLLIKQGLLELHLLLLLLLPPIVMPQLSLVAAYTLMR